MAKGRDLQATDKLTVFELRRCICAVCVTFELSSSHRQQIQIMWKRVALQARTRAVVAPRRNGGDQIRNKHQVKSFIEQYQRSLQSPQEFWAEAADEIEWFTPYDKVLDM